MFARWSQENFFRYMREHYSLDRLIEYDPIPLSTARGQPIYLSFFGTFTASSAPLPRGEPCVCSGNARQAEPRPLSSGLLPLGGPSPFVFLDLYLEM